MTLLDEASKLSPSQKRKALGKIADLLAANGIDVDDVGRVQRVNVWQGFYKGDDGEPHTVDMTGITLSPKWAEGPEWPVVAPARPTIIRGREPKPKARRAHLTAVILPDPQIGFRRDIDTDELVGFHDRQAIDVALQIAAAAEPDRIVNLGDTLDLAEMSRFTQEAGFALTTQAAVDEGHRYLARQRADNPAAEIDLLEGNHDARLVKLILDNAKAAFGLRQALMPASWPVLSVPHLLRLDDLEVTYHAGYPAGRVWLNDRLCCMHGRRVNSAGSTALRVVDDERVSTIFGHVHRRERQDRTVHVRDGRRTRFAMTPGCLCKLDGSVPSTKSGQDLLGRPLVSYEDWQHGMIVVTYAEGDAEFSADLITIEDGRACFRGEWFESKVAP